jgi:hypothetical protein
MGYDLNAGSKMIAFIGVERRSMITFALVALGVRLFLRIFIKYKSPIRLTDLAIDVGLASRTLPHLPFAVSCFSEANRDYRGISLAQVLDSLFFFVWKRSTSRHSLQRT